MPRSIDYGHVVLWCGLLALAASASGCQRGHTWNLVPVEGTVTKDGQPLHGVQLVFMPDHDAGTQGPRARGTTDEAGHYRLCTDNGDAGTVVGKHRVVLFDRDAATNRMMRSFRGPQRKETGLLPPEVAKRLEEQMKPASEASRVPPSYGSFNETPLCVEVRPGPQVIDLDVK